MGDFLHLDIFAYWIGCFRAARCIPTIVEPTAAARCFTILGRNCCTDVADSGLTTEYGRNFFGRTATFKTGTAQISAIAELDATGTYNA